MEKSVASAVCWLILPKYSSLQSRAGKWGPHFPSSPPLSNEFLLSLWLCWYHTAGSITEAQSPWDGFVKSSLQANLMFPSYTYHPFRNVGSLVLLQMRAFLKFQFYGLVSSTWIVLSKFNMWPENLTAAWSWDKSSSFSHVTNTGMQVLCPFKGIIKSFIHIW